MKNALPPIPEKIEVVNEAGDLIIRLAWFSWVAVPAALFALVWNGFLVFWFRAAFQMHPIPWAMVLFPILHVALGVYLAYYSLCLWLNTTEYRINPNRVRIRTAPLPWLGNCELATADIKATKIREKVTNNKNSRSIKYVLVYVDAANRERSLSPKFDEREQAEYVEYFIRQAAQLGGKN